MDTELIIENQNATGGGLAVNITGKYESNRHALAKNDTDKLTAGEAAKIISKKSGKKITAKQLVAGWSLKHGYAPEWHHAGFIPNKKQMARTYFFSVLEVDNAVKDVEEFFTLIEKRAQLLEAEIIGFFYTWETYYTPKKRSYKVLQFFTGMEKNKPRNFTACTIEQFNAFVEFEGAKYYGWDEPTIDDLQKKINKNYEHGKD